jgi:hypothetical protein
VLQFHGILTTLHLMFILVVLFLLSVKDVICPEEASFVRQVSYQPTNTTTQILYTVDPRVTTGLTYEQLGLQPKF